ncbi:MAG: hypothetical protein R3F62_14355 [Planctomycetota bacterium]
MHDRESDREASDVDAGYALERLRRALEALETHTDPALRRRAVERAERWREVLAGMEDGTLRVGSRTPVEDTPAWVTLEVAHGGFATGRYLAESALDDAEAARLATLPAEVRGDTPRERLNLAWLGDAGIAKLSAAVRAGAYRVEVPEHGALPVIVWLLERRHYDLALDLIAALRPLFHRLRFAPALGAAPRAVGALVRLRTAGDVADDLRATPPRPQVASMHEALRVWNPLYDRLVALWLETVEGEAPRLEDGRVLGGWPCARFTPEFWAGRDAWSRDYAQAAAAHPRCGKHRHPKSNFSRLREVLLRCEPERTAALSGRDVGWVRRALANTATRRGALGSPRREALRRAQAAVAALPSRVELAELVAARMSACPRQGGLSTLEPIEAPAARDEHPHVPEGHAVPRSLVRKAARALEAPLDELIERGVIASSEVLAQVLPQLTAQVAAAGIADPELRGIYEQVYGAFRRRRSLLLLDLQSQVRLEELPWIAALERFREDSPSTQAVARQTLEQVTLLALVGFPHTLLPNPLVTELRTLAKRAKLTLPLVQEVAADIFMGTFTVTWQRAAERASELLAGTLYARYYDLPPAERWRGGTLSVRHGLQVAEDFAEVCRARAAEAEVGGGGSWVARNGAILEQSQILTTHGLAVLVQGLGLEPRLRGLAPGLARAACAWLVRRASQTAPGWRAQLQAVKNGAYAWRQALFFLSFCTPQEEAEVVAELEARVAAADPTWAARFAPALEGLRRVRAGDRFDDRGAVGDGLRYLGWSVGKHWLL